jgi:hypothetical protein
MVSVARRCVERGLIKDRAVRPEHGISGTESVVYEVRTASLADFVCALEGRQ